MIPDINLLPSHGRRQSSSKFVYILLTVLVLLIVGFFVIQYFSLKGDIKALSSREQIVLEKRDKLQRQLDEISIHTGSLSQSVEYVEIISYPVSPIIDETMKLRPGRTYLRQYSFDATSAEVKMDFETLNEISSYVSKLASNSYIADVQIASINHFKVDPLSDGDDDGNFNEVPRYEVTFTLLIDHHYLATGGAKE